jgi:integrase
VSPYLLSKAGLSTSDHAGTAREWDPANASTIEKLSENLGLKMPARLAGRPDRPLSHTRNEHEHATDSANPFQSLSILNAGSSNARYITPEEMERLKKAVETSHNPSLKYIVALVVLTGERLQDLLTARWDDIDLETRQLAAAAAIVKQLPRWDDCPYAIANPRTRKPYHSFFGSWDAARKKAGLADISIHDLRNSGARSW